MVIDKVASILDLTNAVLDIARKQYGNKDRDCFLKFIELYYSQASADDLVTRSTADLYGLVLSHWTLASTRRKGQQKLDLFNPSIEKEGWVSEHSKNIQIPFTMSHRRKNKKTSIQVQIIAFLSLAFFLKKCSFLKQGPIVFFPSHR